MSESRRARRGRSPASGVLEPSRRRFLLGLGAAAAAVGCQVPLAHAAPSATRPPAPEPCPAGPAGVDPSILAVRDHPQKLESLPAFVFSTSFGQVP